MKKVVVLQHRLLHYRTALFEQLKDRCEERAIDLHLVHGQASRREQAKRDEGVLSWAHRVENRIWEVGDVDLIWQPLPSALKDADLMIIMQESRILSNYPLLLNRQFTHHKIAYWGHGVNLQSSAPEGWRERWKRMLATRVDWWFAYTQSTVDIIRASDFPAERITRLDNAIDTRAFASDLAGVTEADMEMARRSLGIERDAPVGVFCGSLYPDKRLDFLVDAVDRIHAGAPGFRFLVVGDGPSKASLQRATASRPWLHVLDGQFGAQKALLFRLGTVMLNPGAVGLHIVDAFCAGLILVTTSSARHGPEISYLRNGVNAVMTGDNPAEFAKVVLSLLGDSSQVLCMRAAALADAQRYTLDNMVERFVDGVAQCLAAPRM